MTLYMSALLFIIITVIVDLLFFHHALKQKLTSKVFIAAICINTAGFAFIMLGPNFQQLFQLQLEDVVALLTLVLMKLLLYPSLFPRIDRRRFDSVVFLSTAIGVILWSMMLAMKN